LKGKWDSVLADPSIKKLGYTKEFYASHINNKKKKIKKAVSEVDKGTYLSIVIKILLSRKRKKRRNFEEIRKWR
jgi:hypothetical protein